MSEDRLRIIEERLDGLYQKEVSRVLHESRLIEEIVRLEKLEVEFNSLVQYLKDNKIDTRKIMNEIESITDRKVASCAAEIASIDIIDAVICYLQNARHEM